MNLHQQKSLSLIRELAARFFRDQTSTKSLVTVTNCLPSRDGKKVTILITVLPEKFEAEALFFARRHRTELREFIKTHSRLQILPFFEVELDLIEKGWNLADKVKDNGKKLKKK
ncbi:MAG: hypothetical protein UV64_C0025G0011 [Parcubacteria group bacterium GW2011_GWC1_43_11b]|uniref:Ribosome-binding factor A n=1 Tax=Candidatus Vogelbacteria bacterium RIFOXYB1_FULL_42_16 TaxID=1802436 RepID=A0A1G2QDU2_9BACT|nr:MAG: hypothetical protein UV50_C0017G0011 [Parcubacteria group bacterium GW2011_GWB1_42_9]KKS88303.1 MAG: hypothetical protein UV64_C0025G0011 [Parcubacteria group bacterium GW2011_GWC1_43_11b]KKT09210.1 MAG: hypothetical protein UV88_C0014G0008 [Parcubacteria group bacterium GW2011_GWA1_43_21]OHA58131.1 MAG: hypothetical protein A2370_02250 [Candidatus Vogelbacteria bacterium RIFOXYB1_FULL_42_16]